MTWIYRQTEDALWSVGFFTPDGTWEPQEDFDDPDVAGRRVHYLNGGLS